MKRSKKLPNKSISSALNSTTTKSILKPSFEFGRGSDFGGEPAEEEGGEEGVQGDQAPGVPRGAAEKQQQVGLRAPRAEQEDEDMARDVPDGGDGGACARRGGPGLPGAVGLPHICADSTWRLPAPASSDANDIRAAAAEAAKAFRPREYGGVLGSSEGMVVEKEEEKGVEEEQRVFYLDEEEVFGMPSFFADLAEGLLLPPPPSYMSSDDVAIDADVSLWSYSI
ncbi:hypothetical protein L484_001766 [Morus notabilis]|uniref:Uncharacterized protein n=1 Tax=Morus notabilis TaxID=981085 RepID=W9QB80_9ROSA|nr:hypothetical protein L484_001766 [Morus notabilis]